MMDEPGSRRGGANSNTTGKPKSKVTDPSSPRNNSRAHNAEAARKAILDAAEVIFAEHGFDGARIDAIAALSGYNKSLLFQYFGDKLGLYSGVIRRADNQTREMQNQMLEQLREGNTLTDVKKLKSLLASFIGVYFDYMVENPNFMRILNWELAEGWQTYARVLTERDFQDMIDFAPLMQKVMEGGFLRSKFNPMAQIVVALFVNQTFLGIIPFLKVFLPNLDLQSSEGRAQAREFIIDFVTNGLITDPPEAST